MHTCCSGTRRDDDCTHMTRARHRTHARTAASATTRAAYQARVVRRSAGRRRKAARWRADALSSPSWHEERCSVQCAGRAAARGSVSASPTASLLVTSGQSLRSARSKPHAKARAATDNPKPVPARRVGATQGPRAPHMGAHADPQRRHSTSLGHGLRAGSGGAGCCMRADTGLPERLSRRVKGGGGRRKAGRCSGEGRCWGGDAAVAAVEEGDGEGDIHRAGPSLHGPGGGGGGEGDGGRYGRTSGREARTPPSNGEAERPKRTLQVARRQAPKVRHLWQTLG